ncbi:recombinase family protein [Candidatus Saccharibacteria bacterium]|nr:recombinase family protein [Candidatus Saccharibacteria bacterium]
MEGWLEVVPEEAEIVKRIFSMYLSGKGRQTITRQLNRENNKIWGALRSLREAGNCGE